MTLKNIPYVGILVIAVILVLFVLSLIVLFSTYAKYKKLGEKLSDRSGLQNDRFFRYVVNEFAECYKSHGIETNTPAIISDAVSCRLSKQLLAERFLGNAVSLFVTLGLFGTFLGLSLSVGSLTELISFSNTEEWLSVLDSVGGGLMSALSGMGVAFYTSLVGVACSILLTILKTIFSPSAQREILESKLEIWMDESLAPTLPTDYAKDDASLIHEMMDSLSAASDSMQNSLKAATDSLTGNLAAFDDTVRGFNSGIHDFSEIEYSLRGSIERLDLSVRDIGNMFNELRRRSEGSSR